MKKSIQELEKAALDIRLNLLKLCNKEVIHIGGYLSIPMAHAGYLYHHFGTDTDGLENIMLNLLKEE